MMNAFVYCTLFGLLIINCVSAECQKRPIAWNGNWAMSCDFLGNDLSNAQIPGELCGGRCAATPGCTHFAWTRWNGGTCWMKTGRVSKKDACSTNDPSMVCGVVNEDNDKRVSGVHTTYHGAHEAGACELPASDYATRHAVALGNIDSLKHLKFRPELCGQVLNIDCGNGPLDVVVMNSNLGGGLDLYASTWKKLTNGMSPGITACSVQLSSRNPLNSNGPRCFYKPDSGYGNEYYRNVGLLNTNGRIVSKATIDGHRGEHRGDNAFFAFNFGRISVDKQVVFTFEDGGSHTVYLRDCEYPANKQHWS